MTEGDRSSGAPPRPELGPLPPLENPPEPLLAPPEEPDDPPGLELSPGPLDEDAAALAEPEAAEEGDVVGGVAFGPCAFA